MAGEEVTRNATVRVACQQLAPKLGDVEANRRLTREAVREAIAAGAGLVILPELSTSGYVFESPAEARACAEPASGPSLLGWVEEAGSRGRGRDRRVLRAGRRRSSLQLRGGRGRNRRSRRVPKDPPVGPGATLLRAGGRLCAGARDPRRADRRRGVLRPPLSGDSPRPRPGGRRADRASGESAALPTAGGAADGGHAGYGHGAFEPCVLRALRPLRARARGRVGRRKRRLRRAWLAARRTARGPWARARCRRLRPLPRA